MATIRPEQGFAKPPVPYRALAGFIVACAAFAGIFVTLALSAFHAPRPHGVPVGIVASALVTGHVEHALDSALPGAIDWRSYPSAADARTAITQRQVAGALVATGPGLRALVAQGGGSGPADFLTQAFTTVAARSGQPLAVTDVVPPLPGDTYAFSPFFLVLGVLIPSLAAGSGSALAFRRSRPALAVVAPAAVAVVIGVVSAAIGDGIAGLGNFWAIAGVVTLFSLAVAAPTALLSRIKPPLVILAVLAFIVAGIPDSGGPANINSFGPGFLRVFDYALPFGLASSIVRNVVYFGGHETALHLWILAAWSLAGLAGLIALTTLRRPAPVPAAAEIPPVAATAEPVGAVGAGAVAAGAAHGGRHARPEAGVVESGAVEPITVVVGFDNSAPARRALVWAADLLRSRPGTLHVIYADHPLLDSDLAGFGRPEMDLERDEKAAAVARAAADIAAGAGVPYTFERRRESPADAMMSAAGALDGDASAGEPVIVTGRSHHAPHRILGSVPVELLRESPYPVLTIS